MIAALIIYVTGILTLGDVMASYGAWECLCGESLCEWCSNPPAAPVWLYGARGGAEWSGEDMVTLYDIAHGSLVNGV